MTRGRWLVSGAVVLAVAAASAVLLVRHERNAQAAQDQCAAITRETAALDPSRPVTTGGRVAVILGDSWAAGTYLTDPRADAWPAALGRAEGWTTYVNAVGGTGFVNAGACGGQSYGARVDAVLALQPAVVVIEGGLNDDTASAGEETRAEGAVLARLAGVPTVIVVGPARAPSRPHTATVDGALAAGAASAGRRYVSALGFTLPLRADGLHMTAAGHPIFARDVAAALS